jgi:hypothetical protein
MKPFPEYNDMMDLLITSLFHLHDCDSHSDFDAEMNRFIAQIDALDWSEYREMNEENT